MTLGEWYSDAESLSDEQIAAFSAAIQTLKEWPAFKKEYGWTGIFVQATILDYEKIQRIAANVK